MNKELWKRIYLNQGFSEQEAEEKALEKTESKIEKETTPNDTKQNKQKKIYCCGDLGERFSFRVDKELSAKLNKQPDKADLLRDFLRFFFKYKGENVNEV